MVGHREVWIDIPEGSRLYSDQMYDRMTMTDGQIPQPQSCKQLPADIQLSVAVTDVLVSVTVTGKD